MLCVGLDPDPARYPASIARAPDATERFCREIIDATADVACAFKPQIAYFASQGDEDALENICNYIRSAYPDVTLILDAKRGDIGSTATHYAREAYDRYGAHAVTVNPYMGTDSIEPFFDHPGDGGVILLCRTSNPGGDDFQSLVARRLDPSTPMSPAGLPSNGHSSASADSSSAPPIRPNSPTSARSSATSRCSSPASGAQGGDAATVMEHGAGPSGRGLIVNSSRAILYASNGDDFAEAARAEAVRTAASLPS